jgi:hypothetical protein
MPDDQQRYCMIVLTVEEVVTVQNALTRAWNTDVLTEHGLTDERVEVKAKLAQALRNPYPAWANKEA